MPPEVVPHAHFGPLLDAVMAGGWTDAASSPSPTPVVIPSVAFGDYLQLRIADRKGVCMGMEFLTSRGLLARTLDRPPGDWARESLAWRILPHVEEISPLLGVTAPMPRERLALAELVADRFDQYAHFRPELVRRWLAGQPGLREGGPDEFWQRVLFDKLRAESGEEHPVAVFQRLRRDRDFLAALAVRFPRLLVLGSGSVDPLLVEMVGVLSEAGCRVAMHVLLPSLEYLGDLRRRQALPPAEGDPEESLETGGHPLLESMGRHAIGTFLLLGHLDEQYTHWPESGEGGAPGHSLLGRVQADLRAARPPGAISFAPDDASLRFHACFGPRREMETLRDEILRAFREIPGLKPGEIHIVTPSLETYAPLVTAVFEHADCPLPVRLMERFSGEQDPVIEGLLDLLGMAAGGRGEASALLNLFHRAAVQAALGITGDDADVGRLRRYVVASGLTQGVGNDGPGTWRFSRDRLIAGRWFGVEGGGSAPDGTFVLPVADVLGDDPVLRDRFLAWHGDLESTLLEWTSDARPPVWAARLERASRNLVGGPDATAGPVREHLAFLRRIGCEENVDAAAVRDWLESVAGEQTRRTPVSGKISFGRFRHLQNLPCRVLAMVGLQDRAFPGNSPVPAWDLLRRDPRAWDRNARVDDRQLFLDAVLAPSDRLVITASARNLRSGKSEPLSSCVDELLRVAATMGAPRSALVFEHRLQPFSPPYFERPSRLPLSFDSRSAEVAARLGRPSEKQPFWAGPTDHSGEASGEITLEELFKFWKDPAAGFLRARGIRLDRPPVDDDDLDWPVLTPGGLAQWQVRSAVVGEAREPGGNLLRLQAGLTADRLLPPGRLGDAEWEEGRLAGEALAEEIATQAGGGEIVSCELAGGIRVAGELTRMRSGDGWFAFRIGKLDLPGRALEAWMQALLASASGHPGPMRLVAGDGTRGEKPAPARDEAAERLAILAAGFREGRERPLPFALEISDDIARDLEKDRGDAIERAAAKWEDYIAGRETRAAARLAWRDRDPFDDAAGWIHWAETVARPLRKWWQS